MCGKHGSSGKTVSTSGSSARHAASTPQPATTRHSASTGRTSTPKHAASGDYTVAAGDTLGSIATSRGVDGGWKALADANPDVASHPDLIMPGQQLTLPGGG